MTQVPPPREVVCIFKNKQGNENLHKNFAKCLVKTNNWSPSVNAVKLSVSTYSTDSVPDIDNSIINCRIKKMRCFKLASVNINKLSTHIDEVRILLADKHFDVLAIQETKLNISDEDYNFSICGYELIRRDRLSNNGGSICLILNLQ